MDIADEVPTLEALCDASCAPTVCLANWSSYGVLGARAVMDRVGARHVGCSKKCQSMASLIVFSLPLA